RRPILSPRLKDSALCGNLRAARGTAYELQRRSHLDRWRGRPGRLDIPRNLFDEVALRLERLLVPQPQPELDDEPLAVEIADEVQQVRLDPPFAAAVVG